MVKVRKTVPMKDLIEYVNNFNAKSLDSCKDEREGKNHMLEVFLMKTGNFNGFKFLTKQELSHDAISVGIREPFENGNVNFTDTDHTRIKYF